MSKKTGFTIIELVMVIAILGVLAAVAIPRYIDLRAEANEAAELGVAGGVRAGIMNRYVENCAAGACAYPGTLDAGIVGVCAAGNVCFDNVLEQGGIQTDDWEKTAAQIYQGPNGGSYTYNPATGEFN